MRFFVHGSNLKVSTDLCNHAERRIRRKLLKLGHHVREVVVRLRDEDPSRLDSDRVARVMLTLSNGQVAVVEQVDADLYRAIDELSNRVMRLVRRRKDRMHTRLRGRSSRRD